jgi:hypothetical protein
VKSWTNIRHENDFFATSISIGRNVIATPPADEPDPHELVGYLRGSRLQRSLRELVRGIQLEAPAGCSAVRQPPP